MQLEAAGGEKQVYKLRINYGGLCLGRSTEVPIELSAMF